MSIRRVTVVAVGVVMCIGAVVAQDAWTPLGLRVQQGERLLFLALKEGRVYGETGQAAFAKATGDARLALVNGLLTWARQYTESPEFAKEYAADRKAAEPRVLKLSPEEEVALRQSMLERRLEAEKKSLEAPPSPRQTPEQQQAARKSTEEYIKRLEIERARYLNADTRSEMRRPFELQQQRYREDRAKWEEQYPADFRAVVARRLHQFLDRSANIDFAAKLVPCKNSWQKHMCFADPNYENKPPEWKYYYRAGKQPVEAARAFATNWLADLEKK